MPKLSNHHSTSTTKMLFIGDSGAGKTGALASLAFAGYNLRILDLDNGIDVLANILRSPPEVYRNRVRFPEAVGALDRVEYETLTDPMRNVNNKLVPAKATVWQRVATIMSKWAPPHTSADFGPLVTWTSRDILVIDSMTMLCNAAMNFVLAMNARLGQRPHQSDWYEAQQLVESFVQMLYDENVKCNVIVACHVQYIGEENGPQHGYPATLGKALSPRIGRYFNSCLMARTMGSGTNVKRSILTTTQGMIELKNTSPMSVPASYPLETGLADYFRDVRGPVEPSK